MAGFTVHVHVYAQKPPINVHADISREARRLIFGLSFVHAQEPDVRSSYHLYSLKTKRSRCHYGITYIASKPKGHDVIT